MGRTLWTVAVLLGRKLDRAESLALSFLSARLRSSLLPWTRPLSPAASS